jgi:hypothetical protein
MSSISQYKRFWDTYGRLIVTTGVSTLAALGTYFWYTHDMFNEEEEHKPAARGVTSISLPYRDTTGATDLVSADLLNKASLDDITWEGKRVILRTDYNVVVNRHGYIEDVTR